MKHLNTKHFLFYFFALAAFFFDITMHLFFAHHIIFCVLLLYVYAIITHANKYTLLFLSLLLCAESLFYTGMSWLPIIYTPLLFISAHSVRSHIDLNIFLFPILACYGIALHTIALYVCTPTLRPFSCTVHALCANLVIVGIFSLKLYNTNSQDNRSPYLKGWEESPDSP